MSRRSLALLLDWLTMASVLGAAAAGIGAFAGIYMVAGDSHGQPLRIVAAALAGTLGALFGATPYLVTRAGLSLLEEIADRGTSQT